MPSTNQPSKRLFIGSLPYKFTEGELLSLFIPFGKVVAIRIIHNRWGKSRGLGYVEFDNLESAQAAKLQMHNHLLVDRTIIVDYAQPDPFDTPEGKERHQLAQNRRQQKYKKSSFSKTSKASLSTDLMPRRRSFSPKTGSKPLRQTVYDSRRHGARVGAKFAAKNKKK